MKQTGVQCFVQRQDAAITEIYFVLQSLDDVLLCLVWTIKVEVILETRQMFRLSVPNESFLPGKKQKKKRKSPTRSILYIPVPQTERVSATGTRRIKLNLCTRVKFLQNGLKRYSPNSSFIFMLKVCSESTYFTETKIF